MLHASSPEVDGNSAELAELRRTQDQQRAVRDERVAKEVLVHQKRVAGAVAEAPGTRGGGEICSSI